MRSGTAAARLASEVSGPFSARPAHYVEPLDAADLGRLAAWAAYEGVPLVPRGGGTGMPGGNLGPGVVVSIEEGFRTLEPLAADGSSFRVGAGVRGAEVERAGSAFGRTFPPLPSSAPWCTLGGMVSTNAAGARSFGHGAVAEWVEAVSGIDALGHPFALRRGGLPSRREGHPWRRGDLPSSRDGAGAEAIAVSRPLADVASLDFQRERPGAEGSLEGWPRVRKNSSGYALDRFLPDRDLLQLLIGSEGTLGFITEVEVRTAPAPAARGVALVPAASPEEVTEVALGAREIGCSACEFLGRSFIEMARLTEDPEVGAQARGAFSLLLLEVEGTPDQVTRGLEACAALGRKAGAGAGIGAMGGKAAERLWALRHAASPMIASQAGRGLISTQFIEDSVVPIGRLGEYLGGLERILSGEGTGLRGFDAVIFGHAGDGNVHVNPLVDVEAPDWEERVRATLAAVVGLVVELGGTLAGEHGDGRLRTPFVRTIWGDERADTFGRIKAAADPAGILNPGVIVALAGQDPLDGFTPRARRVPSG